MDDDLSRDRYGSRASVDESEATGDRRRDVEDASRDERSGTEDGAVRDRVCRDVLDDNARAGR
jgi:hypothetical protein